MKYSRCPCKVHETVKFIPPTPGKLGGTHQNNQSGKGVIKMWKFTFISAQVMCHFTVFYCNYTYTRQATGMAMTCCRHQPMRCKLRQKLRACPLQDNPGYREKQELIFYFSVPTSILHFTKPLRKNDEFISPAKSTILENSVQFSSFLFFILSIEN